MSHWIERSICSGPSKWELMLALFECKRVVFSCKNGGVVEATITSIERRDADGECWNLKGHIIHWKSPFTASYSTRSRKGLLRPVPEEEE